MRDLLGLGVIIFVLLCGLYALASLGRPPAEISDEEYERRIRERPGLLSAGVIGLQKILEPGAKRAAEVQEDLRQGYYDGEQESGEGGAPEVENLISPNEEEDA